MRGLELLLIMLCFVITLIYLNLVRIKPIEDGHNEKCKAVNSTLKSYNAFKITCENGVMIPTSKWA